MTALYAIVCSECGTQLGFSLAPVAVSHPVMCHHCMQNFCIVADALGAAEVPGSKELYEVRQQQVPTAWENQHKWNQAIFDWHRANASFIVELNGGCASRRNFLTK